MIYPCYFSILVSLTGCFLYWREFKITSRLPQCRIDLWHLSEIQRMPDTDQTWIDCGGRSTSASSASTRASSHTCLSWVRLLISRVYTTFLGYTRLIFCGHLRLGWIPGWYQDKKDIPSPWTGWTVEAEEGPSRRNRCWAPTTRH